jgi:hypothetical protein
MLPSGSADSQPGSKPVWRMPRPSATQAVAAVIRLISSNGVRSDSGDVTA